MKTLLERCRYEEEIFVFESFSQSDALELGLVLLKHSKDFPKPVAVEIVFGGLIVFSHYPDGTNKYNQNWLRRKRNLAEMRQMSTLTAFAMLEDEGKVIEDWTLNPSDYVACGGCFPIRLRGSGMVGSIGVSGLPHLDDNRVITRALSEYLGVEYTEE